mgnify:CR=1 FL=1
MNLNLNLGAGALDIPIARKLDISDASERSLQAPVRPAQAPGRARPGSARAPPSDASVLSGPAARWNDGSPDGALESGWSAGIRMERWESAMGRWHYYWPQAAQTARQAADPALWASPVAWGSRRAAYAVLLGSKKRVIPASTPIHRTLNLPGCPSCAPAAHAPPGGP